ncbi:MAG: hypothetical protein F6K10_09540 [Moorea sp. SIO2B7]|nr:hypothetical protein [Moorena sp. SIO2B7]
MIIVLGILVGLVSLRLLATLAETLLWWYFWNQHSYSTVSRQSSWKNAIVFLTGISDYAAQTLQTEQIEFLQAIGEQFPVDRIIAEPFPYESLTAQRFSRFEMWRKLGFKEPPLWVISMHNFWQTVLVTGLEKTYGNAVARCIINRLGFPASADGTLWFICGSTGASLALAAVPKLREQLQVSFIIIAYGGVFRASPGFDHLEGFYHLIGESDIWAKLGQLLFPGRYLPIGALARASKENRFRVQYTGNHKHLEYLSDHFSVAQAKTYRELTINTLTKLSVWQEKGLEFKG